MMKKIFAAILCLSLFITILIPADINIGTGAGTYDFFDKEEFN